MAEILILTEAGGSVGFGHLTRCVAIADGIGSDAMVLAHLDEGTKSVEGALNVGWRGSPIQSIPSVVGEKPKAILVDSYLVSKENLKEIRSISPFLTVIDDFGRMKYPCDLVVNPSVQGPDYSFQEGQVVSGAEWVILRPEIRSHPQRIEHGRLNRLLVCFGGADKHRLLDRLLPSLCALQVELCVLAGSEERASRLREKFSSDYVKVFGRLKACDMASLISSADLAVSAGGQTLNELAFLGVPFLAIQSGEDQYWNIHGYVKNGVTPSHFNAQDAGLERQLLDSIEMMRNIALRTQYSERGKKMIDGMGGTRIARLLQQQL